MPDGNGLPPEEPRLHPRDLVVQPQRFFEALASRPRRLMPPFAVVLATVLVGALGGALLIVSGRAGAEGRRALELLAQVDMASSGFAVGVSLGVVLGACASWIFAWLPLRITAGAHPRLWELAGFAHAPFLAATPLQLGLVALQAAVAGALALLLSMAATVAACAIVWGGLRALAPEAALRGTVAYLLVQLLPAVLGGLLGGGGGGGAGRIVF